MFILTAEFKPCFYTRACKWIGLFSIFPYRYILSEWPETQYGMLRNIKFGITMKEFYLFLIVIRIRNSLKNSWSCVICARINYFEASLMILAQKVDFNMSRVRRIIIQKNILMWKIKMATVMLAILDGFAFVWVLMYGHSKYEFLLVTLNF